MTNPSCIEWVVFDAVGTTIFPDPPLHMAYHRIGRKHGSAITPVEASRRFKDAFGAAPRSLETSPEREREFWRSLVGQVIPDCTDAARCFDELWKHFAAPTSWGVYADLDETLAGLRERGLGIAIASNFDERLHEVCAGHPDLASIETRFISSEVGWKKPARQFFEAIVARLGVSADRLLMVGDSLNDDVLAARQAGLQAIHLNRGGNASAEQIGSLDELLERIRF